MTIATDIAAANTAIATALASCEAQMTILEADHTTDAHTFGTSGGPQAAGALRDRMAALKVRCDALVYDNR
jgi:hypothetical protein